MLGLGLGLAELATYGGGGELAARTAVGCEVCCMPG